MLEESCPICRDILLEINEMCLSDFATVGEVEWTAINAVHPALGIMFTVSALEHFLDVKRGTEWTSHGLPEDSCGRRSYSKADAEIAYKLFSDQFPKQYRRKE